METAYLIIAVLALALVGVTVLALRAGQSKPDESAERLAAAQAELAGRLQQLSESHAASQAQLNRTLEERLDGVSKRLGDGLNHHTEKTGKTMKELHERLAVIDSAQKNITELSEQVVSLQDILSNKQSRGAFGEIQLNDLVTAVLPPSAYSFQATLANNKRADCLLVLPNPPGPIVIDSKFPLESYEALRTATTDAEKTQAARSFSADVIKHVRDIAEKYIIPGETAESALMFLPSEAVYAELHANFRNVVEESYRRRVWIVSPTTLWATLNTIRAVLKDVHMREQAGVIQTEVLKMLEDVGRLDKRVGSLETHFRQAGDDIKAIRTSTDKITRKGGRIEEMQLGEVEPDEALAPARPQLRTVE
ncbi:MAG: DNA recombination protein RmuC [Rhodospirillales bacterium]|nr:DNA recombination protein RmuC [Rhodospirillales bacterium]